MKRIIYLFFALACTYTAIFAQGTSQPEQIILKLNNNQDQSTGSRKSPLSIGNEKVDRITQTYQAIKIFKQATGKKNKKFIYVITFPKGTNIQRIIEEYYQTGEVDYAEPDGKASSSGVQGIRPNDQYYAKQWSLNNDGTFAFSPAVAGADIDMERAWDLEQGSGNIIVGVIDSGAKLDHPEFSGRIWTNTNEIESNGIDDDHNGYIDDVRGWNFSYANNDPTDDNGHGTNVAGIIGANGNNNIGYAGIDWNCKLMILKGIDSTGSGFYSWFSAAVYYAVDNGVKVINMSIGGTSNSITLQDAIHYAITNDVVVVAAMANANSNVVNYPAGCSGVIAVGSTDANDNRSDPFFWNPTSGSNYGSHISVVAPGNYIFGLNNISNINYNFYWGGTSQATPHVTGLAALLFAKNPSATARQIKLIIEKTAEDQVGKPNEDIAGWDQYYGHGRINAFNALSDTTVMKEVASSEEQWIIYPNPTPHNVSLTFPITTSQVVVINALGEIIFKKDIDNEKNLTFQLFDNGAYIVQLITSNKTYTQKLIVYQ
jgi:thermitase